MILESFRILRQSFRALVSGFGCRFWQNFQVFRLQAFEARCLTQDSSVGAAPVRR